MTFTCFSLFNSSGFYCSLTTLPRGIPSGLTSYLVGKNQISHVRDPSEYTFCINCSNFILNGNPWQCDLKMILMMKWLISNNVGVHTFKTSCQQRDLAGKTMILIVAYMEGQNL